jgi:hypothetical protein
MNILGYFYDRFIRGLWVSAEGLIYSRFAIQKEKYIVTSVTKYDFQNIYIGIL